MSAVSVAPAILSGKHSAQYGFSAKPKAELFTSLPQKLHF